MSGKKFQSFVPKGGKVDRKWYVIDATDAIFGRLATRVATILMGKNKPTYTPFMDTGDFVIVTNIEKARFTGRKLEQRSYMTYSLYPGGEKHRTLDELWKKRPADVLRKAVRMMLPKNTIARRMIRKLKIYKGPDHPHKAQQPVKIELTKVRGGRVCLSSSGEPGVAKAP